MNTAAKKGGPEEDSHAYNVGSDRPGTLSHLMNEVYPREGQAGLMEKQVWMGVSAP